MGKATQQKREPLAMHISYPLVTYGINKRAAAREASYEVSQCLMVPQIVNAIVTKYGLARHELSRLVNWNFADYAFSIDWDVMSDTIKFRQHGFFECIDSTKMFLTQFDVLRRNRIIPSFGAA